MSNLAKQKLLLDYVFEHECARGSTVFLTQPIGGDAVIEESRRARIEAALGEQIDTCTPQLAPFAGPQPCTDLTHRNDDD